MAQHQTSFPLSFSLVRLSIQFNSRWLACLVHSSQVHILLQCLPAMRGTHTLRCSCVYVFLLCFYFFVSIHLDLDLDLNLEQNNSVFLLACLLAHPSLASISRNHLSHLSFFLSFPWAGSGLGGDWVRVLPSDWWITHRSGSGPSPGAQDTTWDFYTNPPKLDPPFLFSFLFFFFRGRLRFGFGFGL